MMPDFANTRYIIVKKKKSNKKKLLIPVILLVLLCAWISGFSLTRLYINAQDNGTPDNEATVKNLLTNTSPYPNQTIDKNRLGEVVQNALSGTKGSYGIVVLNLKTGEHYLQNETRSYETASLYKLWVMAATFDQIKNGKLKEDDTLCENLDSLDATFGLATPAAQLDENGSPVPSDMNITQTIRESLEKMITVSDNNSALLLSEKVGLANVQALIDKYSFAGSHLGTFNSEPVSTPIDMALFLKDIYEGKLIDKEYSAKMLDLLKRQQLNTKIPKYLPDEVIVAHKTGELDEFNHDAGIVFTPKGDYIIVVMSESDIYSRVQAENRIALVSEGVYKYFTGEED